MPFDYEEYQKKCNSLSTEQLQKEWENYTRQIAGGATSTATSVLFSPLTAGISLVGLGLSAPRIHNARKKREIIEKGLQARGTTHNTRTRDVAGSMAVSGAIAGLTLGLATPGADMLAGEVAGKGAEYVVTHVALDGAGAVVEHKHDGHLKKKGAQQIQMNQMQMRLNQYQGLQQQQFVQGQQVQMQPIQGVQMQGGFQQPGLTNGMQIPQPGMLMQNQQQIQWQQQPSLQVQGYQQPQMQIPGQYAQVQVPPRPHSAAPNNQYQYGPPAGNPAPQFQQEKYHLVTVPSTMEQQQQQQPMYPPGSYPPDKSPAYTTLGDRQNSVTPLPLYSQQAPTGPVETRAIHPTHIDIPEGPTMEEEIAFLKAKLLQMELEKRGLSATISSPCEISLDAPEPTTQKPVEKQAIVSVQEVILTPEKTQSPPQDYFQANVEADVIVQNQQPTHERRNTLPVQPSPDERTESPAQKQHQPLSNTQSHQYSDAPPPASAPYTLPQSTVPVQQQYAQLSPQSQISSIQNQSPYAWPPEAPTQIQHDAPVQQQQYVTPPIQTPYAQAQANPQVQQSAPQPAQAQYSQPSNQMSQQPQKYSYAPPGPQHQRTSSLAAPPTPAGRPLSPAPPQQQYNPNQPQYQTSHPPPHPPANYAPIQQQQYQPSAPQTQQQPQQPVYQPSAPQTQQQQQQQTTPIYQPQAHPIQAHSQKSSQPPTPIQRQDSGYYSQAPTPLQRPSSVISSISSISSPINRHNSIASYTTPTTATTYQPQPYTPSQQPPNNNYPPHPHPRSQSLVSPLTTPAPPPYFAPPPTSSQPASAGKDYFNQGTHPSFPNYAQNNTGHRGSVIGVPGQGWQWGAPGMQPQQQQMQGMGNQYGGGQEPVYAPVGIPGVWKGS